MQKGHFFVSLYSVFKVLRIKIKTYRLERLDELFKANFTLEKCRPYLMNLTEPLDPSLYQSLNSDELKDEIDVTLEEILQKVQELDTGQSGKVSSYDKVLQDYILLYSILKLSIYDNFETILTETTIEDILNFGLENCSFIIKEDTIYTLFRLKGAIDRINLEKDDTYLIIPF